MCTDATESLQQLEAFLPRTNPRTARAAGTPTGVPDTASALSADQIRPIASLKRILVQLLGILSFSRPSVGDQVRKYGGVQLILGMTEVDENNPCELKKFFPDRPKADCACTQGNN